ncbi:MAG: DUF3656 domain-containing protein [Methanobacterium sp.]|nr:DUF3656 domain-containing protein [Methanobacterium sp.]
MVTKTIPELLAPSGSFNALEAAVNAGADAIYLSGKSFGARFYAENFDEHQMKEAIEYAHLRNLKVYVTVNTLVKDSELLTVAEHLFKLYQLGIDAVILQDVGVASICRDLVPDLDMHTSTQMTINNLEGVRWAYNFGFKRVVLARELSLEELKQISRSMGKKIELEIFIHGALCYSYSGQCLLSSVIGGRSGNRGRCAQPCRKPYRLLQGEKDDYGKLSNPTLITTEKYLLSTRDLASYNQLNEISNLSLNSLKIEGRMRSAEYVALVVSIYRKALDAIKKDKWVPDEEDLLKLKLAFNRGFTSGYMFEDDKKSLMGREAPGNRGLYLGKVIITKNRDKNGKYQSNRSAKGNSTIINLNPKLDSLKSNFKLEKGDGIVFISPNNNKKPYGMIIEEEPTYLRKSHELILNTKKVVPIGSKAYQTRDISLLKIAENIIQQDVKEQTIPLDINLKWNKKNNPILDGKLTGANDAKLKIHFKSDLKMEKAINRPLNKNQIVIQLKKTGGTPFNIRNVEIDYPGNLFTPLSKLNQIRREFIKKAESKLLKSYQPTDNSVESAFKRLEKIKHDLNQTKAPQIIKQDPEILFDKFNVVNLSDSYNSLGIAVYCSSLESVRGSLSAGCKRVYFEPSLGEECIIEPSCNPINWQIHNEEMNELLLKAHKLCTTHDAELIWKWPNITRNSWLENLSPLIKSLNVEGISEIMIGNLGSLRVVNNLDLPLLISGSVGLNLWNHRSVLELSSVLDRFTLSNELSYQELLELTLHKSVKKSSFDLIVQGNLDSLVSEDCLLEIVHNGQKLINRFWGIEDVKKRIFPLWTDDEGRTHISNSVELCLINYLPQLNQMGIQHLIIDTRNKPRKYAEKMISYYLKGLDFLDKNQGNLKSLYELKNKVKKISQGGITTGNFIKGLSENS